MGIARSADGGMLGIMQVRITCPVFVGRTAELERLTDALARASAGEPAALFIGGEAGVGKSRLVEEFARRATDSGARVLTGGCVELGAEGLPFAPVTAALRAALRELGPDDFSAIAAGAESDLVRLVPELGPSLPDLVGSNTSRSRLFEHLLGLLERLAQQRPLVLVVEDLHWADRSTRELLGFLLRALRGASVLLVATYRSDETPRGHPLRAFLAELDRLRTVERVELHRFTRREVAEQLAGILGSPADANLVDRVTARSEGNAFFVEELTSCVEDGSRLPGSLRDLLLVRVERLPEATQRLLRVAAVSGVRFGHGLIAAVTGADDDALTEALRPAVDGNVLVADEEAVGYAFRHALLHEALHDDLLPGERTRLHRAYAEALEADPALVPSGRAPAEMAHHWSAAHNGPRALAASYRAADDAAVVFAYAEQFRLLERVLALWWSVPDAAELIGVDHLHVIERAIDVAVYAGDFERGLALVGAALEEVDRDREPVRAVLLLVRRGHMLERLGRSGGVESLRTARAMLPAGPSPARAAVLSVLACSLMILSLTDESRTIATEAIEVAQVVGDRQAELSSLITLATNRVELGEIDEGLRVFEQARALSIDLGDLDQAMRLATNYSHALEGLGRHDEAVAVARGGIREAKSFGLARTVGAFIVGNLAESLFSLGRWDEAERLTAQALELDPPGVCAHMHLLRGDIALAWGDRDRAVAELAAARKSTEDFSDIAPQYGLPQVQLEAAILLDEGHPELALDVIDAALASTDEGERTALRVAADVTRSARECRSCRTCPTAARSCRTGSGRRGHRAPGPACPRAHDDRFGGPGARADHGGRVPSRRGRAGPGRLAGGDRGMGGARPAAAARVCPGPWCAGRDARRGPRGRGAVVESSARDRGRPRRGSASR